MVKGMTSFYIFDEFQDAVHASHQAPTRHLDGMRLLPSFSTDDGDDETVVVPFALTSNAEGREGRSDTQDSATELSGVGGGRERDAEMGGAGGDGGPWANNKVAPLPPKKKTMPFWSDAEKAALRANNLPEKRRKSWGSCVPVMMPRNVFFNFWDPVLIMCLIFTAIVTPVEVAFLRPPEWPFDGLFYVNRVVDGCFVIDMCLQFNLGYNFGVHASNVITDRWKIITRYLKGSFMIDFISIVPYDYLPGGVSDLKALRMARLLKLFKLLRVLRAGRIFKRLETSVVIHYGYMKLVNFFFIVIFSAHLMACAFRLVAGIEGSGDKNWILNYFGDEKYATYDDPPWATLYLTAYYWAIMTMTTIGYGDVLPVTAAELVCTTVCMMIGTSIYAYIFGNICSILDGMTMRSQTFHNTMDQLNTFMEDRFLPEVLRVRLREYYRYKFEYQGLEDWRSLMSGMSPVLQGEVAVKINGSWLRSIALLRDCDDKMYTQISLAMTSVAYCPLEMVVHLHELPTAMHIVERGIVGGLHRIYPSGTCLGEDCLWQPIESPRSYSAATLSYATLLSLQRADIMDVVAFFPHVRARLDRAGARARAQQKVIVYARAVIHFKHALRLFTWTDPNGTGEVSKGSMMLSKVGMEAAMEFVCRFPPCKDLYRVDPLFPNALDGVVQACWGRWQTYQNAASKIQSAFRGRNQRKSFLEIYRIKKGAASMLQRGIRTMLFRKRLRASFKMRESLRAGDPNADLRLRLGHIEDKLATLGGSLRDMECRGWQESQFLIGMLAEVHTAVRRDSQASRMVLNHRTLAVSGAGAGAGGSMQHKRRGFKGF
jgi:hypothetical protein